MSFSIDDNDDPYFLKADLLQLLQVTTDRHSSAEALKLSRAASFRLIRKLDNLGLIKLLPGNRIRLPSVKAVRWTGDGEFIRKLYRDWSRALVEASGKTAPQKNNLFLLKYLQMTPYTYAEFKKALRNLEEEFVRRSIHEMRTQPSRLVVADNCSFVTGDSLKPSVK